MLRHKDAQTNYPLLSNGGPGLKECVYLIIASACAQALLHNAAARAQGQAGSGLYPSMN